jgi:hypothetical protein
LVVATSEDPMRGVDYRVKNASLTLLVAKSFSNPSEMMQGLCRVGRFGDICERFVLNNVQLYDKETAIAHARSLFQYLDEMNPVAKAAKVQELKSQQCPKKSYSKKLV